MGGSGLLGGPLGEGIALRAYCSFGVFWLLLGLTLGKCQLRTVLNTFAARRSKEWTTQPMGVGQLI